MIATANSRYQKSLETSAGTAVINDCIGSGGMQA